MEAWGGQNPGKSAVDQELRCDVRIFDPIVSDGDRASGGVWPQVIDCVGKTCEEPRERLDLTHP